MSLPREMTVVEIAAPGGPEQLQARPKAAPRSRATGKCWCASPPPGSIAPMSCSVKVDIRRRPEPPICPGSKSPGKSSLWDRK